MPINLKAPQLKELKPRIVVCGVGGAGGNAVNNMIVSGLTGVDFVVEVAPDTFTSFSRRSSETVLAWRTGPGGLETGRGLK